MPGSQYFSQLSTSHPRRLFLRSCALVAAGLFGAGRVVGATRLLARSPGRGPAWLSDPDHPEVPNAEVAKIIDGIVRGRPFKRDHVQLDMPVVAEDGRVVPVIVESDLPMTAAAHVTAVHLIVDHNPDAHLAVFRLTPALGAVSISTRIKMKRTTWVRALVETSTNDVWAGYAKVSVTLNGCG
jgi:sulfur-oxidizing protein SoxY